MIIWQGIPLVYIAITCGTTLDAEQCCQIQGETASDAGLQEVDREEIDPINQKKVVCPLIVHGEPLTDRKSTFQAHAAEVQTTDDVSDIIHCPSSVYDIGHGHLNHLHQIVAVCLLQVEAVLAELKTSKKIATATHNILAYR